MGRKTFSREFKISAVGLVQQQGYTVVQAAKSLGIDATSLRGWLKQFTVDGAVPPVQQKASPFCHFFTGGLRDPRGRARWRKNSLATKAPYLVRMMTDISYSGRP
jgi:transposase-like protein